MVESPVGKVYGVWMCVCERDVPCLYRGALPPYRCGKVVLQVQVQPMIGCELYYTIAAVIRLSGPYRAWPQEATVRVVSDDFWPRGPLPILVTWDGINLIRLLSS
jgi:hypothetical protein